MLATVVANAEEFTTLLDDLRADYAADGFAGPDPLYVALDQAGAAARDLRSATEYALELLARRAPGSSAHTVDGGAGSR